MSLTMGDAGTCIMVRGETKEEVEYALKVREAQGYKRQGDPALIGRSWIATIAKAGLESKSADDCQCERIGHQVIIRGPTEFAVSERITSFLTGGATVAATPQRTGPVEWTAILDAPR